jgi:hypothetical protein
VLKKQRRSKKKIDRKVILVAKAGFEIRWGLISDDHRLKTDELQIAIIETWMAGTLRIPDLDPGHSCDKDETALPDTGMVLVSHRGSIVMALSSSAIRFNKKMHINCGSSACMAGIVCANEDQIWRQGRWINTTMNSVYITGLPREMKRLMAGFLTNGRSFHLSRASLGQPISLCRKLSF